MEKETEEIGGVEYRLEVEDTKDWYFEPCKLCEAKSCSKMPVRCVVVPNSYWKIVEIKY